MKEPLMISLAILLAALLALGCGDAAFVPEASSARVDSAGVQIVTSPDADRLFARLDSIPELSLGGIDAPEPIPFSEIAGIHVQRDGSIWVADEDGVDVRIFSPRGDHIRTVGGRGEGPAEFSTVQILGGMRGDSVVVTDPFRGSFVWYGPGGDVGRTGRFAGSGSAQLMDGILADGGLVGQMAVEPDAAVRTSGGVLGDSSRFVVWDSLTAEPSPIGTSPTRRMLLDSETLRFAFIPFTANAGVAVGELVWTTSGHEYGLRAFDRTGLVRSVRIQRNARPVDDGLRDAYREWLIERSPDPSPGRELSLEAVNHDAVPDHAPAFDDLIQGLDGSLWARRWEMDPRERARTWDVFGADGEYVGHVEIPARLRLEAADETAVWGVWTGEFDVEYVRRYRFVRP